MEVGGDMLLDRLAEGSVAAEVEHPPGPGPGGEAPLRQDYVMEQVRL